MQLADRRRGVRSVNQLANELGIDEDDLAEFQQSVEQLVREGNVVLSSNQTVALPPPGRVMIGMFRKHPRGFGFIVPDEPVAHGDLFVPAPNTGDAMTGDRVRAKVLHRERRVRSADDERSPYIGRIVEILQRAEHRYVGNLVKRGSQWLVLVDGKSLPDPVIIHDPGAKGAGAGSKVVIELIQFPTEQEAAEGVILEVLGEQGEPDVETVAVMRAYGLEEKFPPEVDEEARAAASGFDGKERKGREDLTDQYILTIDPPDARDFDDAISIRRIEPDEHPEARYELGVHIADVAAFVQLDGAIDAEAKQRGNSVYLPRKVIPMIPELLSNGVCSLQEGVPRYTKSAFIKYDADGKVVDQRVSRSVIRSNKRLTYLEAQALIDGDIREARRHAKTEPKYGGPLVETLQLMDELAKVIRKRRFGRGMIVLDLPEVELVFDESGHVVDAVPEDDAFTHRIIEMFMVEANEAVARLFDSLNVPMIRRIHPDPPQSDMQDLRAFARVAGFNIPANPTRGELQSLLDAVRGKPAQQAVHFAVLQTLAKAEYAPLLIGHFALASEHYTHFTSPIRRYPDLVVHRALDAYLDARGKGGKRRKNVRRALEDDRRLPAEGELVEIGKHCSGTERKAESAERDLRSFLVLRLMEEMIGDDFEGTVTGVTSEGVFIQLDKYLVDGFVRAAEINLAGTSRGDRWKLNRQTGALVAQRSGLTIQIGDRTLVRIANVQPWRRQMDLVIMQLRGGPRADQAGTKGKPPKRKQGKGAKKAHQETMKLKGKAKAKDKPRGKGKKGSKRKKKSRTSTRHRRGKR